MKTKILFIFGLILGILTFNSCKTKQLESKSLFDDKCPLSYKVEWTIVDDGVAVDKQIALLSQLSIAAKADAENLGKFIGTANAEVKTNNTFSLSKAIQSETVRKAQVSQDVFDEFIRVRTASCNIWDALQAGIYGNDEEAIKEARKLFTSIQDKFSDLEKKKSQ